MKIRYCKYFDADMDGCYCTRRPSGNREKDQFCDETNAKGCPYFEAEYDEDDKALIKEVLKFMRKECVEIDKATVNSSNGGTFLDIFEEFKKRVKKKYGIK